MKSSARIARILSVVWVSALSAPRAGFAQDADTFSLSGSTMDGQGTLQRQAPTLSTRPNPYAGLATVWARNPLVLLYENGDEETVVGDQLGIHLMAGYNFSGRFRLDLQVPTYPSVQVRGDTVRAFGDIRLGALVPLLGEEGAPMAVALAPYVMVPSGNPDAFVTNGGPSGGLVASFGGTNGQFRWVMDGGLDLARPATLGTTTIGSGLDLGIGGSVRLNELTQIGVELDQRLNLARTVSRAGSPMEAHAYATFGKCAGVSFTGGVGTAIVSGVGSPDVRLLGALSWRGATCGPFDTDLDGIEDDVDRCPLDPEDMDGFQDDDGCPEDNDGDGVPDAEDECPMNAGRPEDRGCPDRDGDGLIDLCDYCPDIPGPQPLGGCPDRDKDTFSDFVDACPDIPGGPNSTDGCPPVTVTHDAIVIIDKVMFETNGAEVAPDSYPLLDRIAMVLRENPHIRLLEVQGHTDERGSAMYNLDLSKRRANAVRSYLIRKGVEAERVVASGFGEGVPIAGGHDAESWAINRRVEFKILEQ